MTFSKKHQKAFEESLTKTIDNTNCEIPEGCGVDLGEYFCGNMGFSMRTQKQEALLCEKCRETKENKG